jgi:hypothetical protein
MKIEAMIFKETSTKIEEITHSDEHHHLEADHHYPIVMVTKKGKDHHLVMITTMTGMMIVDQ